MDRLIIVQVKSHTISAVVSQERARERERERWRKMCLRAKSSHGGCAGYLRQEKIGSVSLGCEPSFFPLFFFLFSSIKAAAQYQQCKK